MEKPRKITLELLVGGFKVSPKLERGVSVDCSSPDKNTLELYWNQDESYFQAPAKRNHRKDHPPQKIFMKHEKAGAGIGYGIISTTWKVATLIQPRILENPCPKKIP